MSNIIMTACPKYLALIGAPLIVSCSSNPDSLADREDRVANALKDNASVTSLGSNAVWLVKSSSLAPNDRTAVFFGYTDNMQACEVFVDGYAALESDVIYRCEELQ